MTTNKLPEEPVKSYPLTITTRTPVCVKSHEEPLSPLADYVYEKNKDKGLIYFINPSKFQDKLKKDLIEKYIELIRAVEVNEKNREEKFRNFLKENNIEIKDISDESRSCTVQGKFTEISRHIRSAGKVYIPGSSLKGAITTALFYDWMKSNKNLWECKIKNVLNNYWEKRKNLNNGGLDEEGKDSHDLIEIKKETKKQLDKEYKSFFDQYLNRTQSENAFNFASFYGFADSNFVNNDDLEITGFSRQNINSENSLNPNLFEVIKKETCLNTVLSIQKSDLFKMENGTSEEYKAFENTFFSNKELISFFKILNDFSTSYIDVQIDFVSNINSADPKDVLNNYLNQLLDLKKEIKDLSSNSAIIALGFGKSFLQTTIALLLDDETKIQLLSLNKNASDKKTAPKTFYINEEGSPLGWIKITDENENAYKEKIDLPDYKIENLQEGDQIKGILIEKGSVGSAQISLNGVAQEVKANGLSKYEKLNNQTLKIDHLYQFKITVIKNLIIKEIKII